MSRLLGSTFILIFFSSLILLCLDVDLNFWEWTKATLDFPIHSENELDETQNTTSPTSSPTSSPISMESVASDRIESIVIDKNRKVYTMHYPRTVLFFMYRMTVMTLHDGFRAFGLKAAHIMPHVPRDAKKGDIVIWIGSVYYNHKLLKELKRLGLVTILYQTEPLPMIMMNMTNQNILWGNDKKYDRRLKTEKNDNNGNVDDTVVSGETLVLTLKNCKSYSRNWDPSIYDEIWDYGKSHTDAINACRSKHNSSIIPRARYVPSGYLEKWPHSPDFQQDRSDHVVFLGSLKHGRQKCWNALLKSPVLKDRLKPVYDLWNEAAFQNFTEHYPYNKMFISFHKYCEFPRLKESVAALEPRAAIIMSTKGLLISDRCYAGDEAEWEGLLDFVEIGEMEKVYLRMMNLSLSDRQRLVEERFEKFKIKFSPKAILERARIPSWLAKS